MSDNQTPDSPGPAPPPPGGQPGWASGPPPGTQPGAPGTQPGAPGAPGTQPTWGGQPPGGPPATTGLDPKIGAMLSYLLFGWIGGLIMYFTQRDREVRFHAAQSIIVFGALTVLSIGLTVIATVLAFASFTLSTIVGLVNWLVSLASLVLWIVLSIKGYNLEHFKLPVAGDMAERWAVK